MKISLLGPETLTRFTDGILRKGLEACGCETSSTYSDSAYGIIQIHGSPAAHEVDVETIYKLPTIVRSLAGSIILLHRPDEIKDCIPQLKLTLSELPATTGLAMLGDLLIKDPFYNVPQLQRRVIPHGFFDFRRDILRHPIIIGSHTTWGEMRSVKRTLTLLKAVAEVGCSNPVIGYLGGGPPEELSQGSVNALLKQLGAADLFTLRELSIDSWHDEMSAAHENTIFLYPGAIAPPFDVTFNVQLYHYGSGIRMGESSGSIHASAGIPVIFEMNGAERFENLTAVKVPYTDRNDVNTADFRSAAQQIVSIVYSGEYQEVLAHNRRMTMQWSNQRVARLYIDFLQILAQN